MLQVSKTKYLNKCLPENCVTNSFKAISQIANWKSTAQISQGADSETEKKISAFKQSIKILAMDIERIEQQKVREYEMEKADETFEKLLEIEKAKMNLKTNMGILKMELIDATNQDDAERDVHYHLEDFRHHYKNFQISLEQFEKRYDLQKQADHDDLIENLLAMRNICSKIDEQVGTSNDLSKIESNIDNFIEVVNNVAVKMADGKFSKKPFEQLKNELDNLVKSISLEKSNHVTNVLENARILDNEKKFAIQ
ncbi:unnamed protein product [Caenorhabditis bovis]|uniref:Uncharacterized protein n=1 Tax=Caenorhabditis bovis TaxID=2654633 RepID=A0A8S1EAI1_9PELO|nr:unnamed protein product [Caenorhabditis bovis]